MPVEQWSSPPKRLEVYPASRQHWVFEGRVKLEGNALEDLLGRHVLETLCLEELAALDDSVTAPSLDSLGGGEVQIPAHAFATSEESDSADDVVEFRRVAEVPVELFQGPAIGAGVEVLHFLERGDPPRPFSFEELPLVLWGPQVNQDLEEIGFTGQVSTVGRTDAEVEGAKRGAARCCVLKRRLPIESVDSFLLRQDAPQRHGTCFKLNDRERRAEFSLRRVSPAG